jgi:hypothetical protein
VPQGSNGHPGAAGQHSSVTPCNQGACSFNSKALTLPIYAVVTSNGATVYIECPSTCEGTAEVTTSPSVAAAAARAAKAKKKAGKTVLLGSVHFKLKAHQVGKLHVALSKAGRKLVRHLKTSLSVQLTVTIKTAKHKSKVYKQKLLFVRKAPAA